MELVGMEKKSPRGRTTVNYDDLEVLIHEVLGTSITQNSKKKKRRDSSARAAKRKSKKSKRKSSSVPRYPSPEPAESSSLKALPEADEIPPLQNVGQSKMPPQIVIQEAAEDSQERNLEPLAPPQVCAETKEPVIDWNGGIVLEPKIGDSPPCGGCGAPVGKLFLRALGSAWHPDHFCCKRCGVAIGDGDFFDIDGCSPACGSCKEKLLICFYCSKPLGSMYLKDAEGKKYHESCANRMVKCSHCNEYIRSPSIVEAMGRYFHPDHFFCTLCNANIQDSYGISESGAVCHSCLESYVMSMQRM